MFDFISFYASALELLQVHYTSYSKTCLKRPLKKTKIGYQDGLLLNAGQKY